MTSAFEIPCIYVNHELRQSPTCRLTHNLIKMLKKKNKQIKQMAPLESIAH